MSYRFIHVFINGRIYLFLRLNNIPLYIFIHLLKFRLFLSLGYIENAEIDMEMQVQAYLEDINTMGLVSDHQDVTGGMKFLVQKLFGFSVYIKVMFTLCYNALNML